MANGQSVSTFRPGKRLRIFVGEAEEWQGKPLYRAILELVQRHGAAGAIGALCRYLLGRFIAERTNSRLPLGTLLINITGAFVIGLLFALTGRHLISSTLQTVLATGFLGGYTTFSTMSWEGTQLARGGSTRLGFFYLSGSILLGLLAASAGLALGWWL